MNSQYVDGWHRQELPVAEGREVFIYDEWLGSRLQKSIYPFGHRPFLAIWPKQADIKPVDQLLLLLLRNPGSKLPGPPAKKEWNESSPIVLTALKAGSQPPFQ
ncbi:MAG: hypothetical protein PVH87_25060 [Desulfobacteraceae bacterium]